MKGRREIQPVQAQPVEQPKPIEIPFSVVMHYQPGRGVLVIPIGVNLPYETVMQMLDLARTEIVKAQLAQMKPVGDGKVAPRV